MALSYKAFGFNLSYFTALSGKTNKKVESIIKRKNIFSLEKFYLEKNIMRPQKPIEK